MDLRKKLRAKERGLLWLSEKLRKNGFTLAERIEALDQADRDGISRPAKHPRFKPRQRAFLIQRAKQRKAKGEAMAKIAADMGVTYGTIERWTRGVKCPVNHRPKRQKGWRESCHAA
ncbi:hypothetical protein [Microvirga mediterraneensis]|uniref:Uncharacterized protein n=1 Tax=Microvirga mediterraneensis TaxID=2754695 RepID=A0A838BVB6_9HYPH|nr:hypothetical protein [Microvirga mediterraneensis]MBA1159371.1 hypothetical protein [Microvirga mediterraneensis]